jgi:hypothetical protein
VRPQAVARRRQRQQAHGAEQQALAVKQLVLVTHAGSFNADVPTLLLLRVIRK